MSAENYKIPNLNEGLDLMEPGVQDNRMLRILENINRPVSEAVEPETQLTATCPECGATWTPDVNMEDGSAQICPVCDHICNPVSANTENGAMIEDEPTITENCGTCEEEDELEEGLEQYMECIDNGDAAGARSILENLDAEAICESTDDGVSVMLEKFVIKIDSSGKKKKVKVRTKKVKRTPAQKAALKKARKMANKGAAKKKRKKAMKARARMGLTESLRKTRTLNAVQSLVESKGFILSTRELERAINEAYDLHEAEVMNDEENVLSTLENILRNKGIEILNSEIEIVDGVIVAHLEVSDTDSEVYLGDVADETAEALNGYDVDYDEPENDEADDSIVFIDFYFVPILTNESTNCGSKKMKKNESTNCGSKKMKKNESENCSGMNPEDCEEEPEDGMEERKNCGSKKKKMNESIEEDMFESFAGGSDNVRCKINPAFIKQGQVIYDADEHTVFTALTESVACSDGFSLAVDIKNSLNESLANLVSGAEVSLDPAGSYFLLKSNPLA